MGEKCHLYYEGNITPEGYVENDVVYTITIDDKGNATITGDGAENGKIANLNHYQFLKQVILNLVNMLKGSKN
ncbi:MAG: hypothetical protein V8R64_10890 [Thomasclavelia sp.]